MDKIIEEYEKRKKRDRRDKIALIIIIIILLLLCLLGYRMGKIGYQNVSTNPTDNIRLIEVRDNDILMTKDTPLNIFENSKFEGEKIIAPKSNGSYKFCIENVTEENISYAIKFEDKMDLPINMKYRLKMDNVYIKGNKDKYVSLDELNVEDIIVLKDSINVFTIEWYWEDDDINDTIVGSQESDQYYTLNLKIVAEKFETQGSAV